MIVQQVVLLLKDSRMHLMVLHIFTIDNKSLKKTKINKELFVINKSTIVLNISISHALGL